MSECNVYRVLGKRDYRGHTPGTEFPAHLDPKAARRAIDRGSIECIGTVVLQPARYIFPKGWLQPDEFDHPSPERGSFIGREE